MVDNWNVYFFTANIVLIFDFGTMCVGFLFNFYLVLNRCLFLACYMCFSVFSSPVKFFAFLILYLLCSATSTHLSAKGFKPRKVVRFFNSSSGISRSNFAMHSSANEFVTTLTPVKSRMIFSSLSSNGRNCSLIFAPISRVPKSVPN